MELKGLGVVYTNNDDTYRQIAELAEGIDFATQNYISV